MVSTFFGLEIAKRGMQTSQSALYVTGHNVSNANTPGYTRQRVNFNQTAPYPNPSMNRPQLPGQMGTGVEAGAIQRIRDNFVDGQYRSENNKLGYWAAQNQALSSLETIMNEPSDLGIANALDELWTSLQDLSVTPQDSGARSVVRQRGATVADTFNYIYNSLQTVQTDYKTEIDVTQKAINSILKQVNDVNQQIKDVEVHGYLPNDLYDQRDRLIDNLSSYVNVRVDAKSSGGLSSSIAEGVYDIYLADNNGNIIKDDNGKNIKLVDTILNQAFGVSVKYDSSNVNNPVAGIELRLLDTQGGGTNGFAQNPYDPLNTPAYSFAKFETFKNQTTGSLKAHIESYGYQTDSGTKGIYPDMLKNLDEMAFKFAQAFNEVHRSGWSITEINKGIKDGKDFFTFDSSIANPTEDNPTGAAKSLKLSQHIWDSIDNISAAAEGTTISQQMQPPTVLPLNTSTGQPEITGRFELPAGEPSMDVQVSWSGTTWNYTISTPGGTGNTTGVLSLNSDKIAELPGYPGVKIDFSAIAGEVAGDNWTVSIANNGGITPKDSAFIGSGSNAAALANIKDFVQDYGGTSTTITSFYQSVIGDMGVKANQANQMTKSTEVLSSSALTRRESVSSVSLDEEMTNMIKFQHAYNAAARNITMVDEMLDRIINNMGVVGR
ncbi:flagellar hook-associated protein FlgK [Cytobacillus spongiae]|uniref:flagellar hook-associated protein FlgK n=1 Tax=Cytobacillus spongiae TaxID=2901381 RepID=UPI001F2BA979|nr:flagellar hook-associated protein FlgK [Cytobacillus spongiae]UII55616.1 flagellar hook-associated protein FlgK [Cytobacillus spongiae]